MDGTFNLENIIAINISEDKLYAYLNFRHVDDAFQCTLEELTDFMKSHGIEYGIKYDVLSELVKKPSLFYYEKTVIAIGNKPKDGENGYVKHLYELDQQQKAPTEQEDGKMDYKQVIQLNDVKKGELIAELVEPTTGIAGKEVTGEEIPAKKGSEARFKVGKNVVVNTEKNKLFSTIDGLVTKTDRDIINVFPVYEVNGDVDYNVGNIDFVGTVVIRGNVLTGFTVKSGGDIRVIGGVEGAILEADGSIEITAGILGGNKGYVKAAKNIKSSFIQDSIVEAGEEVRVSQSIMHSTIRAGHSVICEGSKGLIVGGVIQAGQQVTARMIGNTMSTATVIEVGVLPHLRNEMIQLRNKLKLDNENLSKTEKALAILDQLAAAGQLSTDKLAMRIRLNNTKKQTSTEMEEMKERILEIEKSLENTDQARVDVVANIYSGSKIVIGRYTKYIKDTVQRCSFRIVDGDITMSSK